VAASSVANDLYARLFSKTKAAAHMLVNRVVVLAMGVIAVLLVINEEITVYAYVLKYGWAILGASFGPQVILVLLWKRASYAGCVAGMLVGFVTALLWQLTYGAQDRAVEVYNLPLAFACAFVVNVIVSVLVPDKVRPADAS
jgi:Na+/proline symporter